MSQQELLIVVAKALDNLGIPYMLTGSLASSLHGEPRSTHDIDFVVVISEHHIQPLLNSFDSPEYSISETGIRRAIDKQFMFMLLHIDSGNKVDFWMLKNDPYDQIRFSRRIRMNAYGHELWVSTPEDIILAKLRWSKMSGGSEKQIQDANRVYYIQQGNIDMNYLNEWIQRLNLEDQWEALKYWSSEY